MQRFAVLAFLGAFLLVCPFFSNAQSSMTFNGEKFIAKITEYCSEGNVSCEDVTFNSKRKRTGEGISLRGKTVNVNCPAVCDFRGYEFRNGAYTYYFVAGDNNLWDLNIFKDGKVISTDIGKME